ncbi:MAG: hypothetical protein ACPGWR_27270, partial [Ardenticatenaceae bacterium]
VPKVRCGPNRDQTHSSQAPSTVPHTRCGPNRDQGPKMPVLPRMNKQGCVFYLRNKQGCVFYPLEQAGMRVLPLNKQGCVFYQR